MKDSYIKYHRMINYYETDQMGIVHHSNYIRFFEEARIDYLKQFGMDYRAMEEMGIIIPVTFARCQYLVPLRFEDEVVIDVRLTKYDGIKMELSYEIRQKETGQLCTTGETGHCFLNGDMKPIRMKREFPELFTKLKELVACENCER